MTDDSLLPPSMKSLRVLLVDDDVFMLQLLTEMLKKFGIKNVATATDGKAALTIIDSSPLQMQLLICDLNMPGMDGIEFFRHLAARRYAGWLIISSGSDTRLLK